MKSPDNDNFHGIDRLGVMTFDETVATRPVPQSKIKPARFAFEPPCCHERMRFLLLHESNVTLVAAVYGGNYTSIFCLGLITCKVLCCLTHLRGCERVVPATASKQ